jgi:hypothetical protein
VVWLQPAQAAAVRAVRPERIHWSRADGHVDADADARCRGPEARGRTGRLVKVGHRRRGHAGHPAIGGLEEASAGTGGGRVVALDRASDAATTAAAAAAAGQAGGETRLFVR